MNSLTCMALALYFEARSEPIVGQLAVGSVIVNRVNDKRWPDTVCDVVWQRKQFSFTHDGKSDKPKEVLAWKRAKALADIILNIPMYDYSYGSDHYHTKQVSPYWSAKLNQQKIIGNHIFYR